MLLSLIFITGLGLIFAGCFRDWRRWRLWKFIRRNHDGDIVPGDFALSAGQTITLTLNNATFENPVCTAFLLGIEPDTLRLRTEHDPNLRSDSPTVKTLSELKPGTVLTAEVVGRDGLYRFSSLVRQVVKGSNYAGERLIVLPRPPFLARVQRRQHFRAPFVMPATFFLVSSEKFLSEKSASQIADAIPLHGTLLDLSAGGFCADLGSPMGTHETSELLARLGTGTFLRVRLPIPAFHEPLLARIVCAVRGVQRGGLSVRVACEFLTMEGWQREGIISHLFRLQREQRRAS